MAGLILGSVTWGDRLNVPTHTGGDQIVETGPTNTGGDQIVVPPPNNTGTPADPLNLPTHYENAGHDNGAEKPSSIKVADDKFLKNNGVDAHVLKEEFLGSGKNSNYDIYVDRNSGQLWIFKKGGKGDGIPTGEYIK